MSDQLDQPTVFRTASHPTMGWPVMAVDYRPVAAAVEEPPAPASWQALDDYERRLQLLTARIEQLESGWAVRLGRWCARQWQLWLTFWRS